MDKNICFEDVKFLITGGTGSVGTILIKHLIPYSPEEIRVLSNNENELFETRRHFLTETRMNYILGDIRNYDLLYEACEGIDYIINCAAIKHLDLCEENPLEAIEINIRGVNNIIRAAYAQGIKRLLQISTDKAVEPTSVMGATKFLAERLCIIKNNQNNINHTKISCVRLGNVYGSRGSLVPILKAQINNNESLTLTDREMKRYFIDPDRAAEFILKSLVYMNGGEIFIPFMTEREIYDVITEVKNSYAPKIGKDPSKLRIYEIGAKRGEKLQEKLFSKQENIIKFEEGYIIK